MIFMSKAFANPDALVSTEWLAAHMTDKNIRIVESNEDPLLYSSGHISGAVNIDWVADLNDPLRRDYLNSAEFAALMKRNGISNDTTVVFYGDKNNWWACYAFWVFQLFGHAHAKILDGGRKKWVDEKRELTRDIPTHAVSNYQAAERNDHEIRAFRDEVLAHVKANGVLVDVRSGPEYTGERMHMPDYPNEGALRGGHIPGAKSIPWAQAVKEDGTFKGLDELETLYGGKGVHDNGPVIAYCRIGERSSHTWFVLKYLMGFKNVKNYDGSWTEWGNSVGLPIEK